MPARAIRWLIRRSHVALVVGMDEAVVDWGVDRLVDADVVALEVGVVDTEVVGEDVLVLVGVLVPVLV